MQQTNTNKDPNYIDETIDLRELFSAIYEGKRIILFFIVSVSIIGVIFSLLLPNIYQSKALLVPVNSSDNISGAFGSYGGLAGLAGISLPPDGVESNSAKAIHKISSLSFFENNIMPNIYLPDLMAIKSWDPQTNTLVYDENIYETNSSSWIRDYSYPKQQIPSAQESFQVFLNNHLSVIEDKKSGFSSLSIKHQSPYIAKQWAELVVNEINNFYREKDKAESEKATEYLNQQISMTGLSEIKQVLAQLLQEEIKKLALIEANQFYVFDYIDPPAIMEKKSEPSRALICILASMLGGMLGILYVLIRHYIFGKSILTLRS